MATLQKDTTFTKIFVGGLPYHTTDQSLREFFEQFGDIEEAVVITDRQTGKSRGYGFVTMADRPAAERACKDPNPIIDGRKANVNLAYIGAKPRVQATLPFALKAGMPGVLQGQYGLPQYVYPSAAYGMTSPGVGISVAPGSPLSPTTPSQIFDYASLAAQAGYPASAAAGQFGSSLDAAYPGYAQVAAQYGAPAAYAYAAMPQPGLAGHFATTAHYQPQQIQERLQ